MTEEFNQAATQQDNSAPDSELKDQQSAALIAASSFIIFSVIYWVVQIQSVRELLELAYGG